MAFFPSIKGLSWFAELSITSFPPASISHTQPLPNRPTPAFANCSLKLSKLLKARSDRRSKRTGRRTTLAGTHELPEHRVVRVAAAVVADRGANVLRHGVDALQQILDALLLQLRVLFERRVQIRHVRRMMLVVMNPHRLLVDVRFERVVVVGKRWNCVRHADSFDECEPTEGTERRRRSQTEERS